MQENGGNPAAWKTLARDYFALCTGSESEREKAARQIEGTYERSVETPTIDWFAEKAERIAKEMERRTRKSKREAL